MNGGVGGFGKQNDSENQMTGQLEAYEFLYFVTWNSWIDFCRERTSVSIGRAFERLASDVIPLQSTPRATPFSPR